MQIIVPSLRHSHSAICAFRYQKPMYQEVDVCNSKEVEV